MIRLEINNNSLYFFLSLIPLSIVLGPSISLINVILLNITIVIILINQKDFFFLKNNSVKLIFLLYIYLIINSILSQDHFIGTGRNIGFLRFLLLFISINYFFYKFSSANNIFYFWISIVLIITLDSYFEFFVGENIFGWGGIDTPHSSRIVSFFKDEPIVGAYLSGFILIIFGFLVEKFRYYKFIPWVIAFLIFTAIFLSGERSNTIKIFLAFIFMLILFDFVNFKNKTIILVLLISSLILILNNSNYLKTRYIGQLINNFSSKDKFEKYLNESEYFKLYKSGIAVFKNYPFFGVGNKNYRVETCSPKIKKNNHNYHCLTHPHQIYIELLAEHGLIGTLIILGIIFTLMFKILINILVTKNYIQIGAFCFILFVFTPLLPSGSFFSDFNSTIFWLNFSIMFGCCRNTNIFNYKLV